MYILLLVSLGGLYLADAMSKLSQLQVRSTYYLRS